MKISNELKAGTVILAGVLIAVLFFVKTAKLDTGTYQIKTCFAFAGDLKSNADVKLSGIEAGRLKKINFIYGPETKVECVLEIRNNVKVRRDAVAYIGTAGFVGDAYIGITAGTSQEFLNPGDELASEDPVQMRILMKKAEQIVDGLESVVSGNKQNLNNIVSNMEATTQNFKEFSEDVKNHPWKLMFKGE